MRNYKILIVEDEEDLCEILKFNLEGENFEVDVVYSAEDALMLNKLDAYDLILLDIMMGKMSGLKLAEKIRKEMKLLVPIIFLTAKDTENDTLTGFSLGADDYISKPFSIREVIARIKAVIARTKPEKKADQTITFEGLVIDQEKKTVHVDGNAIVFTKKEYEILELLAKSPGIILSRENILSTIWKNDVIVVNRTVDVNIARIRKKLGKEYGRALVSRSGYGYVFEFSKTNQDNA